eukprot:2170319-Rhodomonas_salina.3
MAYGASCYRVLSADMVYGGIGVVLFDAVLAVQSPVLRSSLLLATHALARSICVNAPARPCPRIAGVSAMCLPGTNLAWYRGLPALRYPVLTKRMAGTICIQACYALAGLCTSTAGEAVVGQVSYAIYLRACYAVSGTEKADGTVGLRACYAVYGTGTAYDIVGLCACCAVSACTRATRCQVLTAPICLRARYEMSGTEIAYQARSERVCC